MDPLLLTLIVAILPASLVLGGLTLAGLLIAALAAPVQLLTAGPAERIPSETPAA
jgi:hypothetical protein